MTSARSGRADSLHLLVMDAHKANYRVATETAVEVIGGAQFHHLGPDDRGRVAAFMRGLNRTAPLAFGHPGLATTAARVSPRLTIQNDIGATDAHVNAERLMHEIEETAGARSAKAQEIVLGWYGRAKILADADLRKSWKLCERREAFWRQSRRWFPCETCGR
ncbi:MAG: hypothetical protein WB816_05905 [Methylocystis sp.]